MRIAILGARGTIGKFLFDSLKDRYNVTAITRDTFDFRDSGSTKNYFEKNPFDIVFNAAINTDSRIEAPVSVAQDNFSMFTSLYNVRNMFGRVVHFASGAEFDRAKPIVDAPEEDLFSVIPQDPYGMSKNVTSRIAYSTDDWYLLRFFGVFHPLELSRRLLPRIKTKQTITLVDKYFDYMYLEDLLPVAESYINENPVYKDMNLVYTDKILLSEFVGRFCSYHQISSENILPGGFSELSYTGNSNKWQSLNMPLKGIDYGLIRYK
jgi:nucleoside-diphosphate-sugar epimerase